MLESLNPFSLQLIDFDKKKIWKKNIPSQKQLPKTQYGVLLASQRWYWQSELVWHTMSETKKCE